MSIFLYYKLVYWQEVSPLAHLLKLQSKSLLKNNIVSFPFHTFVYGLQGKNILGSFWIMNIFAWFPLYQNKVSPKHQAKVT